MAVRFVPNPAGIALLGRTPQMQAAMTEKAEGVAETTREIAPIGPGHGGHYRDQITVDPIAVGARAGARVNARKFTAVFIEFGTSDTPVFAPLRRACDAAGLTLGGDTRR